jgi:hypothetical protein
MEPTDFKLEDLDQLITNINKNINELKIETHLTEIGKSKNTLLPGFLIYLKNKTNQRILIHLNTIEKEIKIAIYNEKELTSNKSLEDNLENPIVIKPKPPKQFKTKQECHKEIKFQMTVNFADQLFTLRNNSQKTNRKLRMKPEFNNKKTPISVVKFITSNLNLPSH